MLNKTIFWQKHGSYNVFIFSAKSTSGIWLGMAWWCEIRFPQVLKTVEHFNFGDNRLQKTTFLHTKKHTSTIFIKTKSSLGIWMRVSRRCEIRYRKFISLSFFVIGPKLGFILQAMHDSRKPSTIFLLAKLYVERWKRSLLDSQ